MAKTEVYSWRVDSQTKAELERTARQTKQSLSALLDQIVHEWFAAHRSNRLDEAEQARIRAAAMRQVGALSLGGGPYTNEKVRTAVRAKLEERRARNRAH